MSDGRTTLIVGEPVLTEYGTALVIRLSNTGVQLRDCLGNVEDKGWAQLPTIRAINGGVPEMTASWLRPLWDGLPDRVRNDALTRLEVVQEILTGYRDGHPALAREGEPRSPFGPGFGVSEAHRCAAMAELLAYEGQCDRVKQRRLRDGEIHSTAPSTNTIRSWVRDWKKHGLVALIDGRSIRAGRSWEVIGEEYRLAAKEVVGELDGNKSAISLNEAHRRTLVKLRRAGRSDVAVPQRKSRQFLSELMRHQGATTRAQKSRALQEISGKWEYPAGRPGQIVAIDVTRADNLVYDPLSGEPCSVEIITAIDVATRVVPALRVVPLSANGIDAGLLLYDVCRPFSARVQGTSVSDWRWVGLPETLDMRQLDVNVGRRVYAPDFSTLQGDQQIPNVLPDAIHCDHGPIFLSQLFHALLGDLGIDLLLSRAGHPTDNPHIERWHETIQRALQQIPGYKGRNVSQRGRLVSTEPLLTAQELQIHLRKFIALDYHREPHTGITLIDEVEAQLCPLELWDAMVEATGRIDVPQRPDLIYQFLPVRWLTIGVTGVELADVTYDSDVLDPYRGEEVAPGYFRPGDRAAPFFVDERDMAQIWFRDPRSQRVEPIPWRGANRIGAPMTKVIVDAARRRIRSRGGNSVLHRGSAGEQILNEIIELTAAPPTPKARKQRSAGFRRTEQSRLDHAEAQQAQDRVTPARRKKQPNKRAAAEFRRPWPNLLGNA